MKHLGLVCTLIVASSCAHSSGIGAGLSLCDINSSGLQDGEVLQIRATYSMDSMHPDVLMDGRCPGRSLNVYGYADARGGRSSEFRSELERRILEASKVRFDVNVSGKVESDENGLWLRITRVNDFRQSDG